MNQFNVQMKVWLLAAISVLFSYFAAASAHAGEGMVERVSITVDAGTVVTIAGGEGKFGPISFKIGARDTVTEQGVVDVKSGSAKDVSISVKSKSVTNVGGKVRQGVVTAGS